MARTLSWKEISELEVAGDLADLYLDIKRTLRVPIANLLYRTWAAQGRALWLFWSATRANVQTIDFENKADSLRSEAVESIAYDLEVPSARSRLTAYGLDEAQLAVLRAELETFHYINCKLLLHCALLKRAVGWFGYHGTGQPLGQIEPGIPAQMPREIAMVDPQSAAPEVRHLLEEMRTRLRLPAVNSDYRALAKWPAYLRQAWADLRPYHDSPYYESHQNKLRGYALELVHGLPYSVYITADDARRHGLERARLGQLLEPFLELLPGLILNIAFWKISLDGADEARRSPFPVELVARV